MFDDFKNQISDLFVVAGCVCTNLIDGLLVGKLDVST
jgi:hypothetical protein